MIYVMSDIHGQKRRFDSVMRQIGLRAEDTLYVLGDVIDRNPDGIGILRRIMAMPNANMLLGNHELMMMNVLYYPPPADEDCPGSYYERKQALWYRNGGQVTHNHLKRIRKTIRQAQLFFSSGRSASTARACAGSSGRRNSSCE